MDDVKNKMLFVESEEYISSLSKCSTKKVHRICPFCDKTVEVAFGNVNRVGHTFCYNCRYSFNSYASLIGAKINRLFVKGFVPSRQVGSTRKTFLLVICDCGKEFEAPAQHIKNGHTKSCGCLNVEKITGKNNFRYNQSITDEQRDKNNERGVKQHKWANYIKKRDKACLVCGNKKNLIAHHLDSFSVFPDLRYNVDNGVTLCRDCHTDFHCNFMGNYRVPCTSEDFEEYLIQV